MKLDKYSVTFVLQSGLQIHDDMKADALQYLDLDLHTTKPVSTKVSH